MGKNLKVNAQFSAGYCVANAVVREEITLSQFEAEEIKAPDVQRFLTKRVEVVCDPLLCRSHYSSDIVTRLKSGVVITGGIDIPPGTPGYPMTLEEHRKRFFDCISFAQLPWLCAEEGGLILSTLQSFDELSDISEFISMLLPKQPPM